MSDSSQDRDLPETVRQPPQEVPASEQGGNELQRVLFDAFLQQQEQVRKEVDHVGRLAAVRSIQQEITSREPDLEEVLTLIATRAVAILGATGAAIALQHNGKMVCRASSGATGPGLGAHLSNEYGLSGECIRTGQTTRCGNAEKDPRVDVDAVTALGIRSFVVVPLYHHRTTVGVLEVFSSKPYFFESEDVHLIELLGGMITTAISYSSEFRAQQTLESERSALLQVIEQITPTIQKLLSTQQQPTRSERSPGASLDNDEIRGLAQTLAAPRFGRLVPPSPDPGVQEEHFEDSEPVEFDQEFPHEDFVDDMGSPVGPEAAESSRPAAAFASSDFAAENRRQQQAINSAVEVFLAQKNILLPEEESPPEAAHEGDVSAESNLATAGETSLAGVDGMGGDHSEEAGSDIAEEDVAGILSAEGESLLADDTSSVLAERPASADILGGEQIALDPLTELPALLMSPPRRTRTAEAPWEQADLATVAPEAALQSADDAWSRELPAEEPPAPEKSAEQIQQPEAIPAAPMGWLGRVNRWVRGGHGDQAVGPHSLANAGGGSIQVSLRMRNAMEYAIPAVLTALLIVIGLQWFAANRASISFGEPPAKAPTPSITERLPDPLPIEITNLPLPDATEISRASHAVTSRVTAWVVANSKSSDDSAAGRDSKSASPIASVAPSASQGAPAITSVQEFVPKVTASGSNSVTLPPNPARAQTLAQRVVSTVRLPADLLDNYAIIKVQPEYPEVARQSGISGEVVLNTVIGRDGSVKAVHAVRGNKYLSDAALAAVSQWRYKPFVLKGKPVEVSTQVRIAFKKQEDKQ